MMILDPMGAAGQTPAEEAAAIEKQYESRFGIEIETKLAERFLAREIEGKSYELVVFDWGGLSIGNDLMAHQLHGLVRWAEDNPSTLVIVRSAAADYLREEIEDSRLDELANVLVDDGRLEALPKWWRRPMQQARQQGRSSRK